MGTTTFDLDGHAHARFDLVERVVVLDEGVELISAVLRDELVGVQPVALHDSDVGGDLARVADEAAEVVLERRRRRLEVLERRPVERAHVGGRA